MKRWSCYLSVLLLLVAGVASAQVANNTSLVGSVTDPDGSALVGAKVNAVEEGTKVVYPGTTNAQGNYAITFIAPGTYDITVEQSGFSKLVKTGVIVPIDQAVRTDFKLQVGVTTSTVTVSASTPPLSTDDATLGETFNTKTVQDLPLLGHNALEIAATASNVSIGPTSSYSGVPPGEDFIGAGQREIQNSLSLDGVSIMNNLISLAPARPSADMISEVQMQSGNYPAQYGSYLGIHINLVSKSGTNDLHGSVYDYVQNTSLNAHQFTDPVGSPKQVQHYNQYGFAVGGPVYIPKLYNGRNKTFFFASYEKINQVQQTSAIDTTLTQAQRNGDFSAYAPILDPATGLQYPGNIIPAAQLQTPAALISQKLESFMVLPNRFGTGTSNGTVSNLQEFFPNNLTISQTLDRIDENIGEKVRLFGRYHFQNINVVGGDLFPTNASFGPTNTRNYAFGYTHIITPRLINDFRIGLNTVTSNNLDYFAVNGPTDAGTALGIPGFNSDTLFNNPGIPTINIDGYHSAGNSSANWFQDDRTVDGYDQISYTFGKHTVMAGAELRRLSLGREAANDARGVFNFQSAASPISTGNAAADFVLGIAQSSNTPIFPVKGSIGEWRDGFFVLDNWQVSQKLTLNYGIRYELPTVPYSLNGFTRILNPQQTALIPDSNATTPGAFVPTPGFKFINPTHNDWAPRVGFAYRVNDKSTLRGGFGIYYNANQLNSYTLTTQNYPLSTSATYNTSVTDRLTFTNPAPGGASGNPSPTTPGSYVSAVTIDPRLPTQQLYQWNLSAGQELWSGAGAELQYLGSHGLHLDRNFYNNTPTPIPGDGTESGDINIRRPNQLFGRIRTIENDEYSHYNALTAILRQRSKYGVSGMLSYTWAHDLDVSDNSNNGGNTVNNYDISFDYGNSGWDIRNRFVGLVTYELPKLQGSKAIERQILGGWQANTIVTLQSGKPYNVTLDFDQANISQPNGAIQRPNFLHIPHPMKCSTQNYINGTSCIDGTAFAVPAIGTFGTARRNQTYGPGLETVNFSLFKNIPIYERLQFQFRAEVANLFNHPNLANPTSDIASTGFIGSDPSSYGNNFGQVTGVQTGTGSRNIQLAGKIIF